MDAFLSWLMLSFGAVDALVVYAVGFLVLVICGVGLPIPEDITLLTMGYLTYLPLPDGSPRPHANVLLAIGIGFLGCMCGDGVMFALGRRYGLRLLGRRPFCWLLTASRIERARRTVERHGPKMLFAARFMPGVRSVGFFTAGLLGTPYLRFVTFDGLAAAISVPFFVGAGWYWGADIDWALTQVRHAEHGVLALILVVTAGLLLKSWRARRQEPAAFTAAIPTPSAE